MALALCTIAAAQTAAEDRGTRSRPLLRQAIQSRWIGFHIAGGRIAVDPAQAVNITSSSGSAQTEHLSIRPDGDGGTFEYELKASGERVAIASRSTGQLSVVCEPFGTPEATAAELVQTPGKPLVFRCGPTTYRAAGLWHLLLAEGQGCREGLIGLLELLRPDWQVAEKSRATEEELVRLATSGQLPDRNRWKVLLRQLADDRYAVREAADRELRSAGPALTPYLESLDFARLEPEQQARVRRIADALAYEVNEDDPREVAASMVLESGIWLSLLGREEPLIRRLAAEQLARLTGRPIDFDPEGEEPIRRGQIEQLRTRLAAR